VVFRCTVCGKEFSIKDYIDEMDDEMWDKLSRRPANRA
jgi:hypothetical protein